MKFIFYKKYKKENKLNKFYEIVYLIYLKIHIYSILYYLKRISIFIDKVIIFFIDFSIYFYRIPRNLVLFILFRPILTTAQYMFCVNWYLYFDLKYTFKLIYYLLVDSDAYNIGRKYRSLYQLIIIYSYITFMYILLYFHLFLSILDTFFLIHYFNKLVVHIVTQFYQLLLNIVTIVYIWLVNILIVLYNLIIGFFFYTITIFLEFFFFFTLPLTKLKKDPFYSIIFNFDILSFFSYLYNKFSPNWDHFYFKLNLFNYIKFKPVLLKKRSLPTWHYLTYPDLKDLGKLQLLLCTLFVYIPIVSFSFAITLLNIPFSYIFRIISFIIYLIGQFIFLFFFFLFTSLYFIIFIIINIIRILLLLFQFKKYSKKKKYIINDNLKFFIKINKYSKKISNFFLNILIKYLIYKSKLKGKKEISFFFQFFFFKNYNANFKEFSYLSDLKKYTDNEYLFLIKLLSKAKRKQKKHLFNKYFTLVELFSKYNLSFIKNQSDFLYQYFSFKTKIPKNNLNKKKKNLNTVYFLYSFYNGYFFRKVYRDTNLKIKNFKEMIKELKEKNKEKIDSTIDRDIIESTLKQEKKLLKSYNNKIKFLKKRKEEIEKKKKYSISMKKKLYAPFKLSPSVPFLKLIQLQSINLVKYLKSDNPLIFKFELLHNHMRLLDFTKYFLHQKVYILYKIIKIIIYPIIDMFLFMIFIILVEFIFLFLFFRKLKKKNKKIKKKIYFNYIFIFSIFFNKNKNKEFPWPIRYYIFFRNYLILWLKLIFKIFFYSFFVTPVFVFLTFFSFFYCIYTIVIIPNHRSFFAISLFYRFIEMIETIFIIIISYIILFITKCITEIKFIIFFKKYINKIINFNFNNIINIFLNTLIVILCIILFFFLPIMYLIAQLIIKYTIIVLTIGVYSTPYMFYYYPHIFPIFPYIYYNLYNLFDWYYMSTYYITYYDYYYNYIIALLYTNDLFIMQNFFTIPKLMYTEHYTWKIVERLPLFPGKFKIKKNTFNSIYRYNLSNFVPTHPYNMYYFLKYKFFYDYLYVFKIENSLITLSKPYTNFINEIKFFYHKKFGMGNRLIDFTLIFCIFIFYILFFTFRGFRYYLFLTNEQFPTNEMDQIVEDYVDFDLEYTNYEEFISDVLEYENENIYYYTIQTYLPEMDIYYDTLINTIEEFDIEYIQAELEFESKFNKFLIDENQYDLYKSFKINNF